MGLGATVFGAGRMVAQRGIAANLFQASVLSDVGPAILPADWLFSQSSRLKGGSGYYWPPTIGRPTFCNIVMPP